MKKKYYYPILLINFKTGNLTVCFFSIRSCQAYCHLVIPYIVRHNSGSLLAEILHL